MSIPSKTTIDNLPTSVSQRYASEESLIKGSRVFQDISDRKTLTRPQVPVLAPIQESQLNALTGVLGTNQSLAIYTIPDPDASFDQIFTHCVFPAYQKDMDITESRIKELKTGSTSTSIDTVLQGLNTIAELNKMGASAFADCRRLKQG